MTATEQNQDRIERQMQTITAQARTIADQAQRISVLSLCLHQALVHAPQFVRTQVAERLNEAGLEAKHG